jgi:type VI secretion system secreted protein Hcp
MILPARASMDFHLMLEGVPGESTAAGHAGEIYIDAFSTAVARSGGTQATFSDLTFTKSLDKASPLLMLKCAQAARIPKAVLTCRTSLEAKPVAFYVIRLTGVKVTQVSTSGGAGGNRPTESFSLSYETIEWEYTPMNSSGGNLPVVKANWNLLTNTGS